MTEPTQTVTTFGSSSALSDVADVRYSASLTATTGVPDSSVSGAVYLSNQIDPNTCEGKLQKVKMNLYRLYDEYVKDGASSNVSHSQQVQSSVGGGKEKIGYYEDFEAYESAQTTTVGKSELDLYLEEPRIPSSGSFDILSYWMERSHRCPDLARMACDILSVPITTVASKSGQSTFSIDSRVLDKYRSSLRDETIRAFLYTRSWLHGFVDYDNEDGDDEREAINF